MNNEFRHQFDHTQKTTFVTIESDPLVAKLIHGMKLNVSVQRTRSFADWSTAVEKNFASIGVLELETTEPNLSQVLFEIHRLSRQLDSTALFAVGHRELRRFEKELLISGFSGVFCTDVNPDRFATAAINHWSRIQWPERSIEQVVTQSLPWESVKQYPPPPMADR